MGVREKERSDLENTVVVVCSVKKKVKQNRVIQHNLVVRKIGSRARLSMFESQLSYLPAMWP